MSTPSQQTVVAVRPPYQDPRSPESPHGAYWLDTSSGVSMALDKEQFLRASRAYQSGHRRFKLLVDEAQNPRHVLSLEPALSSWGPALVHSETSSDDEGRA